MDNLEQGGAGRQRPGHNTTILGADTDGIRPLRYWLSNRETWCVLAAAGATGPRKVAAAARRCLPVTRPPEGNGWDRAYSWPEMQAIAAHLSGEVQ